MLHISSFDSLFESSSISLTPEQVNFLDDHVTGPWKINSSTGLVDVDKEVWFNQEKTESIPVRFGNVGEDFNCEDNQLTSLVGAPQKVGGNFDCSSNQLTSLVGAPQKVRGSFVCEFFYISKGKWGFEGWIDVLVTGDEKARSLISTILPSAINKEMEKNPEEMLMKLKGVWNSPGFASTRKEIVIPDRYKQEMVTLADLSDLGF